ncbi:MAG: nucleotide sugar dehydrogenase [Candidatus Altiarchaeota archaeon]
MSRGGLKAGIDFYLAFSPERVSSGRIFKDLEGIPKIVGGINEESTKRCVKFYEKVLGVKVIAVRDCETAEAVKLFGMTYRDVNIALANEFARYAQTRGIDVSDVIYASNTNPHSHILSPGAGVGGHCAPVYPHFLMKDASKKAVKLRLAQDARAINDEMPEYTVSLLKDALGGSLSGKNILVLGLAFRPNVKEKMFSPALKVAGKLKKDGAKVFINDPLYTEKELEGIGHPAQLDALGPLDGAILVTAHKEYANLDAVKLKERGVKAFVDGRNFLDADKFKSAGIIYRGIGRN